MFSYKEVHCSIIYSWGKVKIIKCSTIKGYILFIYTVEYSAALKMWVENTYFIILK